MPKINILYKEDNKVMVDSVDIAVDEQVETMKKNIPYVREVEAGTHSLKIYGIAGDQVTKEGLSLDRKVWAETEVNIREEDVYYIFKSPLMLNGTGKLVPVSEENFHKKNSSNRFWTSPLGIGIIIAIALVLAFILNLFS